MSKAKLSLAAKYALICLVLLAALSGCSMTRVKFGESGKVTAISHYAFVINKEYRISSGTDWAMECKSRPDEATVLLARSLTELAAKGATP